MNGKLQIETISSLVLKNNPLGDPRRREIPVYLPPSYGTKQGRRYPVLYYLPGFTGTGRGVVNYNPWRENLPERFDRLIAERKAQEAILVIVDGFTSYGGSQYLNSSATGRYEDFVVQEIVTFIEDKFAVVNSAAGRALFGKSSGGFGALTLGMRHSDMFAHVLSHSGDLGFDVCYPSGFPKLCTALAKTKGTEQKLVRDFLASKDKSGFDHEVINVIGMASCYSPNPKSAIGFDFPFNTRTGEIIPEIFKRWQELDPVNACVKYKKSLARLKTLFFDAGINDEFHLYLGARRLSETLKRLKVPHTYEEHRLGHFNLEERLDLSLSMLSKRLSHLTS